MMDPRHNMLRYLTWTFIFILILLMTGLAFGNANACVDCDLNKKEFEVTEKVISTEIVGNTNFDTKVASADKVVTILEKIEKIENDNSVYYDKVTTIQPKKVDGQYCFIKVIIKQIGDQIIKEEILECADGRKKFDGPGYWDLFAAFYYNDINTPEYCRMYSRKGAFFKTPGKVCLNKDGEWEVR